MSPVNALPIARLRLTGLYESAKAMKEAADKWAEAAVEVRKREQLEEARRREADERLAQEREAKRVAEQNRKEKEADAARIAELAAQAKQVCLKRERLYNCADRLAD